MKLTPILIKFTSEQEEHLHRLDNHNKYVRDLVQADMHRETRKPYVFGLISEMLKNETEPVETIIRLSYMLTDQICGEDQLEKIMGRAGK